MEMKLMIRQIRQQFDLSINDLAFMIGVSDRTICRWISGVNKPKYYHRLKIYAIKANIEKPQNDKEHNEFINRIKSEIEIYHKPVYETNISSIVYQMLIKLEMTQYELADHLGYHRSVIHNWLMGRTLPQPSSAEIIYEAQKVLPLPLNEKQFWLLYEQDKKDRKRRRSC